MLVLSRFLAPNGQWHLGRLLRQDDSSATVQFEYPTEPYMLQSLQIANTALQPHREGLKQPAVSELPPGSIVYVRLKSNELLQRAELDSINFDTATASVTIVSTGAQHQAPLAAVVLQETVQPDHHGDASSSQDGADTSDGDMSLSEDEEDEPGSTQLYNAVSLAVLGADQAATQAAAAGPQTDTAYFATWEEGTRGIGSKLLASMGYVKGTGLGRNQAGIANPLAVSLYPSGAGLGSVPVTEACSSKANKKRKRGGLRARQKKFASQNRANKAQHRDEQAKHETETGDAGIFSLINSRLGDQSRQRHMHGSTNHVIEQQASTPRQSKFSDGARIQASPKPQDRKSLIAHQDHVAALRQKASKLEAMAARNSNDKVISAQVARELQKVKSEIVASEAAGSGHATLLSDKERQKKWMKF